MMQKTACPTSYYTPRRFWAEHREASLNWLALGVLLAAWNASNNEPTKLCATRDVDHPESVRSDASREFLVGVRGISR
jgi:hypothetical protein